MVMMGEQRCRAGEQMRCAACSLQEPQELQEACAGVGPLQVLGRQRHPYRSTLKMLCSGSAVS